MALLWALAMTAYLCECADVHPLEALLAHKIAVFDVREC